MSKPSLLDRVREEMRLRHYSLRNEETYIEWIKRYKQEWGAAHVFSQHVDCPAVSFTPSGPPPV